MPLSTTQRFRWGLYGATVLAGLIVAIGLINTSALTRRSAWVLRSASTARELEALQAALVDAETGQRGFLLTRDRRYLEPYLRAAPAVDRHLAQLNELLATDSLQHAALEFLQPLIGAKLAELDHTIALDSMAGPAAARELVISGVGKAAMDSIRAVVAHMAAHSSFALCARRFDYLSGIAPPTPRGRPDVQARRSAARRARQEERRESRPAEG